MAGKIVSLENLPILPRPIVHCHGCFDYLHYGHLKHLEEAKRKCATFIVTITSDKYVGKGLGRPIFNEMERAEMLASLQCVDYVAINNSPNASNALKVIRPDFYVKGRDYKNTNCSEFDDARAAGAEIVFTGAHKLSTTDLLEKLSKET